MRQSRRPAGPPETSGAVAVVVALLMGLILAAVLPKVYYHHVDVTSAHCWKPAQEELELPMQHHLANHCFLHEMLQRWPSRH